METNPLCGIFDYLHIKTFEAFEPITLPLLDIPLTIDRNLFGLYT